MRPFADTNFLARLYLSQDETPKAQKIVLQAQAAGLDPLPITWLLQIELVVALEQHVFVARTTGGRRVTQEQARIAQIEFADDLRRSTFLAGVHVASESLITQCEALAHRHTAKYGFRAYDVLQVGSALTLRCDTFWSFDRRARKLAELEGLGLNPL